MWLPLILLALMASSSACPDLCECHQGAGERNTPALVDVKCHSRAPGLAEIPVKTRSLTVDGAEEYEVIGLLDELEVSDTLNDFDVIGTLNEFDVNDTLGETKSNSSNLPYLEELTVTNCSLVSLNVSWRGLDRVRALNLSHNNLARLSNVLVGRMMNSSDLTRLDLSDNSLTDVSAGAFRTLVGLVKLSLRRNEISAVNEEAFQGLDQLEFLDLSDNRLADLPDSALTPLYSLQKLDLSGNQLQVLGARWFESLDRLRELDVSRNGLARAASGTLQPLPGLSVLKLSENPLKERDVSLLLGTGRRLETVDASRTGLARVPAALTRSVRALRLAGNKLTTIRGGDLDSYPLLRILDISENRLVDIEDDALGRLEVLEELDICGNALIKIPRSLPSSLTSLNLQRNAITTLNLDDLQGLYNLKSLMLNDNYISRIEVGSLNHLPVLQELDLSDNPIETLPANTLSGPSNLARLRMSGLTSLRPREQEQRDMAFPMPTPERLVILDVSKSPVLAQQLLADDATLSACKSLADLNLSETNISSLRFDLSYLLPQLRSLDLSGNDWDCTEDLYWLGEWVRQHENSNKDISAGRCAAPQKLSGSLLSDLPSPPSPLPTTLSTAQVTTSEITPIVLAMKRTSQSNKRNESSIIDSINSSIVINASNDEILERNVTYEFLNTKTIQKDDKSENITYDTKNIQSGIIFASNISLATMNNVSRFHEAPTAFRNVSSSSGKERDENLGKDDKTPYQTSTERNSIKDVLSGAYGKTDEGMASIMGMEEDAVGRTFDNQVDGRRQKSGRPKKLIVSPSKITFSKLSKVGSLRDEEEKRTVEKYSKRLNSPDSNTIAEELNSHVTDSGARVSEALSAGAHPGMLVLVGAAIGAAAALTVVLSRRATVRRRDRYHRHENIEVHTLTPTTELW